MKKHACLYYLLVFKYIEEYNRVDRQIQSYIGAEKRKLGSFQRMITLREGNKLIIKDKIKTRHGDMRAEKLHT